MKTIVSALLALLLFASPAVAQERQKTDWAMGGLYVGLTAVSVADIDTTARAAERGLIEKNFFYKSFMGTPGAVGAVNGAVTGGVALATHHFLYKKGKKKEAKLVIGAWTVVRALVVYHNFNELRKSKR